MGRNAAITAASALRLLSHPDMRQRPTLGPQARRGTATTAAAPLDLDRVDYLDEHRNEVITHTRAIAGGKTVPAPRQGDDLYDWYIEHTEDADTVEQAHRDYIIERHALEHAIKLGDYDAVRPHPCPQCGSWSLFWPEEGTRAKCSDRDCRTPDGMASSWTLGRLAAQKVYRTELWRREETWRLSAT